ncbi:TIGR03668 family PPOX class F420-dependent oxidoreductase [Paractinoplanes brasiliensis]|uniref:PPOX class probable F420-dependent enzyme n=1 Tax=Paractinoplanes brasiliensis TaxID=52695 RepID=A0A4R6JMC5_9ACTN|nr:TIGR03668 family PPOX class F420-dependent oxidoreductase [Actinoplanes brasiliensis]TDO37470.1 PPOX class probable F420-dependent enzyme [Actinoplanes brasiliensis]GID29211.1 PPOX class F420-dependent oxidoreductase [Actinoplanes brasiliensis]
MTPAERFATVEVARLATAGPDGPHLVPIVFALLGDRIVFAVDGKPKRSRALKRLANIAADPRVSVLADHYEPDWSRLWWVRADGTARVLEAYGEALEALKERYPRYRESPPAGPFVEITVERWSEWVSHA